MDTKAICIEPCFPGTKLYEVGDEADFSEIPFESRHCFAIGGTPLNDEEFDFPENLFLPPADQRAKKAISKAVKKEIKAIKDENTSLSDENKELKKKLAKLEVASKASGKEKIIAALVEPETEAAESETGEDAEPLADGSNKDMF